MTFRWWTIQQGEEETVTEPVALASMAVHRFHVLDYLRLVAALSVVSFHYFHDGIRTGRIAGWTPTQC